MDLRHLRYFLAVAEEGHFGRAAERLCIVQPALSMQIRALEQELGAPLFLRTSRRVELTDAGAVFRVEAERTLAQAERAKQVFQRAARGETGNIRIGFAANAAFAGRLSQDLRRFHALCPDVELELREMAPSSQIDAILAGRLDLGYAQAYGLILEDALKTDLIGGWPWLIAMSDDHALARRKHVKAAHIVDEPFILYAADGLDQGQWAVLGELLGREPRIAFRVANTLTVLALAAAGLGIALVPAPLGQVNIPKITYRPLTGVERHSQLLLLSRARETNGAVNAFLETVLV